MAGFSSHSVKKSCTLAAAVTTTAVATCALILPNVWLSWEVAPKAAALFFGTGVCLIIVAWLRPALHVTSRTHKTFLFVQVCLAAVAVVSTIASSAPLVSVAGTSWRRLGLIELLCIHALAALVSMAVAATPGSSRCVLQVLAAAGLPISIYAVCQYLGFDPLMDRTGYEHESPAGLVARVPSTMIHATYLAGFSIHSTLAGLYVYSSSHRMWIRLTGLLALALGTLAVVCSGARAGILGLVGSGIVLLCWSRPRRTHVLVGLAVAASVIFTLFSPGAGQRTAGRLFEMTTDPGGHRLLTWRDSFKLAFLRPWIGQGIETFGLRFPLVQSEELAMRYPDHYHESPHNVFLDVATSEGVPGLVLYIALFTVVVLTACRRGGHFEEERWFLGASVLGSLITHQFICFVLPTATVLFVSMGCVSGLSDTPIACRSRLQSRTMRSVLAAAGVAFVGVGIGVCDVERHLAACRTCIQIADWSCTKREWKGVERMSVVWNSQAWLWYARNLLAWAKEYSEGPMRAELLAQSAQAAELGVRHGSDRTDAHYFLSQIEAEQENSAGAEKHLRQAALLSPRWYKPHLALALLFNAVGKREEALAEIALADRLTGGQSEAVRAFRREIETARPDGGGIGGQR